ncbi:OLC1v1007851C1 [Oldenlandia corymbosa var. corymbosa]|uniref:OLC1v1007851C1 n=1 Tax=Oldenlandia corymbosa var. corymbosa TaxID=529605 RepID=A0AAV1DNK7_OLDCO|nr:OLC1v1007851C1 [Oldenlandia corymbosa var. corymbosa]
MAANSSQITLKLLVDTKSKRVLFAEPGKDAVDFLFHILTLPMGTVIRLLTKQKWWVALETYMTASEFLTKHTSTKPRQRKPSRTENLS